LKKKEAYVEVGILEAGPDTITRLDVDGRKAIALRNLCIDDGFSP
jgi:hypothetical protein